MTHPSPPTPRPPNPDSRPDPSPPGRRLPGSDSRLERSPAGSWSPESVSASGVLRCAASAELRGDSLVASAPPAERWLLIESRTPWPRQALNALRPTDPTTGLDLAAEVARRCVAQRCRPALIRRYGRIDRTASRRWAMVDSRPGHESIRWGDLPNDDHLLNVLSGADPGTPSTEPIYLVCTHGRHDACCAIRGRPAAAALSAAFPDQTWECSHVGGDRFAANLVFLPHSLFYGHVPATQAATLAGQYNKGSIVPAYFRGSAAVSPPVQAAQHFAREAGLSLSVDALHPLAVHQLAPAQWQVLLDNEGHPLEVKVAAHLTTINAALTCAATAPGQARTFTLTTPIELP